MRGPYARLVAASLVHACTGDIDVGVDDDKPIVDPPCVGAGCPCVSSTQCDQETACRRDRAGGGTGLCVTRDPTLKTGGERCEQHEDCMSGWCSRGVCVELCLDACPTGARCTPTADDTVTLGACAYDALAPEVRLGPFDATQEGVSVSFEVPFGTASFTVVARSAAAATRVGFAELVGPTGALFTRDADTSDPSFVGTPYPGASALVVPSSDAAIAQPTAGSYTVRLALYETTDFTTFTPLAGRIEEVRVVLEPEEQVGGALELTVWMAPGVGVSTAAGLAAPYTRDLIARVDELLRPSSAVLGHLTFADLPASLDVIDSLEGVRSACATHGELGPLGGRVNVLLVNDLTFAGGVAGGTPLPVGMANTPASCIVVGSQSGGRNTGTVLAHELGHALGLTHSTQLFYDESDSKYHIAGYDKVSDTPECPSGVALSSCPDYANAMFPFFPLDGLAFSAAQRSIISKSPLVQELPRTTCAPRLAVDVTELAAIGADTRLDDDLDEASCGGAGTPERHYVVQLHEAQNDLELTARGQGFSPVVYVRDPECDAELACVVGTGNAATLRLVDLPPGGYVIAVEGDGVFDLRPRRP